VDHSVHLSQHKKLNTDLNLILGIKHKRRGCFLPPPPKHFLTNLERSEIEIFHIYKKLWKREGEGITLPKFLT
jgi:hypothetical protein